ncbi:hypothetical protein ACTFIR_000886 [Dictyostelium discoideum]
MNNNIENNNNNIGNNNNSNNINNNSNEEREIIGSAIITNSIDNSDKNNENEFIKLGKQFDDIEDTKSLLKKNKEQLESLQNNKIDLNKSSNAVPNNVLKTSTNSIPENKGLKSSTTNLNKSTGLKLSQLFVNPLLYSVASEDHMVLQVSPSPRDIEAANNEEDDDGGDNIPMNKVDSNLTTTTPGGENNIGDDEEITDDGNVKVVQRNKYLQKWDEIWSKFQGIILLVLSACLFSVMALAVKQLSTELSSLEIAFFRSFYCFIGCLLILFPLKINPLGPKEKRLFLSLRGLSGTIGLCAYFYTITVLPLSEAVIISFTSPVMTAALAAVLLKEKWGPVQAICAFLSLCGITVISKPSFLFHDDHNDGSTASHAESDPHKLLYIFTGIIGAFFGAISYIAVRKVGPNVHAFVLVTYFSGLASLVTFPSAFIFQTFKWPSLKAWGWITLMGVFGTVAQGAVNRGIQLEKAAKAAAMNYLQIIFTFIWEITFLHETIDWITILSAGLILSCAIVTAIRK